MSAAEIIISERFKTSTKAENIGDISFGISGKMSLRMYTNSQGNRYFTALGIDCRYEETDEIYTLKLANTVSIQNNTNSKSGQVYLFGAGTFTSKYFNISNDCRMYGRLKDNTTSPANVCIINTNYWAMVSSSSKRYKDIKRDLKEEDINGLYNISPVIAKYKDGYLSEDDRRFNTFFPMFIAEDVEKYFPEAVEYRESGEVEDWNYRIMIPAMFQMIKSQKETIDNQKKEIESLSERISRLESILLKGDE